MKSLKMQENLRSIIVCAAALVAYRLYTTSRTDEIAIVKTLNSSYDYIIGEYGLNLNLVFSNLNLNRCQS